MTVLFACWTGASADYAQTKNPKAAGAVVAMIFVYYMFYTVMHPMTYIYITEVFPFVHRAKGVGLTQTFSRAGSAFNQFVNPIALEHLNWKLYIVYVVSRGLNQNVQKHMLTDFQCWLACETGIIYVLYPETKGPMLEELGECTFFYPSYNRPLLTYISQCLRTATHSAKVDSISKNPPRTMVTRMYPRFILKANSLVTGSIYLVDIICLVSNNDNRSLLERPEFETLAWKR